MRRKDRQGKDLTGKRPSGKKSDGGKTGGESTGHHNDDVIKMIYKRVGKVLDTDDGNQFAELFNFFKEFNS